MNIFFISPLQVILTILLTTHIVLSQLQELPLLINCGLPKSNTWNSLDNHTLIWRSDDNPAFAPPNTNTISTSVTAPTAENALCKTARLFNSPLTYTFSIPAGPIFVRLDFSTQPSSFNNDNISLTKSYMSVQANNNLTLLQYFNPFLTTESSSTTSTSSCYVSYEFHLTLQTGTNNLNLTFSPGDVHNQCTSCNYYGFINGIEIIPVPAGLYINESITIKWVTTPGASYPISQTNALQTMYRINVGGSTVQSSDDTGGMMRTWYRDDEGFFIPYSWGSSEGFNGTTAIVNYTVIPPYTAPKIVYATVRMISGNQISTLANDKKNLTWGFNVDSGFDYVVRLHFCERDLSVNGAVQRVFEVDINGNQAEPDLDVWADSGGSDAAMYKDYAVTPLGDDLSNSSANKVLLLLALRPSSASSRVNDVTLSGVEILKVNLPNGSLAVPSSPPSPPGQAPNGKGSQHHSHHSLPIIIGTIAGALVASLIICAFLVLYRRNVNSKALATIKNSSTGPQWFELPQDSYSTIKSSNPSSGPSLPSDLCRRFSLGQIRVATSDFDESSVIGVGGFGKVYKGAIDDGTTFVAIKRLNPSSKQGAHEFRTEIEMLSRLRHVHLVSLIGYCEDQGEMILVYEYMARGTLREHLGYKNDDSSNNNETLPWKQRLMICLGSARGLHYLHSGAKELIIHRDVKSTNILLDDKWAAKVSDFGLSKVGPAAETGIGHVSTAVKGSVGYLDPEYYRRHQLTDKSDVYSLGVVLFEVLCARPAVNPNLPREQVNLAWWGRSRVKSGTLHTIVDPKLTGQIAPECLRKFGEIAETCVRDHGSERPSMGDVVWSLEFALQLQLTAENNNVDGSNPMAEIVSTKHGDGNGGTSSDDMFSNGPSTWKDGSTGITGTSDSEYLKSDSVFTEIVHPQAR